MKRRSGVTLLEVLVAMFVMGVGMLALLTLFPVGAVSMGQAMRDDRCAQAAANAAALADAMGLRKDARVTAALNQIDTTAAPNYQPPDPNKAGNPVLVDPFP